VLPRVLGAAISGAALVSCFQFVAVLTALAASSITLSTSFEFEFDAFLTAADWYQVPLSMGKGFLFGAGIAAIACWHGLSARLDMVEVPKAVAAACMGAFVFVMGVDVIAAAVTLL
jgi:ABC-type transporter Mla maintaining outer membrane lipid asymmetry permease subunit MlaE